MSDELYWLTASDAAGLLRARSLSSVELTTAVLGRVEALDGVVHAFITVDRERSLEAARAADRDFSMGVDRGPLQGIPVSVKDCFFTSGLRTTAASKIYASWVPDEDSAVIERLHLAGAVMIGKANMFELATGWGTEGHFPVAVNPWDPRRSPGGSSSGSAVAVAMGMGPVSIGTDGGGSVRVPANWTGVTGFKPTYGIISSYGTIPVGPSVSHVGVLARTVRDAAVSIAPLLGYDPRDANSIRSDNVDDYTAHLNGDLHGIRVGVPWKYIEGYVTDDNMKAFTRSLEILKSAGAAIAECEIPGLEQEVAPTWTTIVYAELAAFHEPRFHMAPGDFGSELAQRIAEGLQTSAVVYFRAQEKRALIRAQYLSVLNQIDLIATPTAPGPAPTMDDLRARRTDLTNVGQLARYTRPYNLTGLPAITVPGGFSAEGLPLGFELAGRLHDDALVLRAADAYQRGTDWHRTRPPASQLPAAAAGRNEGASARSEPIR